MPKEKESIIEKIEEDVIEAEKAVEEFVEGAVGKIERKSKKAKKSSGKKEKVMSEEELKEAEAESLGNTKEAKSLEERKKALLAKAEKLKEKIETAKTEELKEQIKEKKKSVPLIPLEDYVKSGIYLGTKVVTPNMRPFVYRRRADGLAIFNTDIIDEKIKEAAEFISNFEPKDIIVVCKRQAGWRVVEKFSELTGIRAFTKKYPAGILTNITLPDFFENKLTIVCDSWLDKNSLNDTLKIHKKVLMICDTNNFSKGADKFIIGNNKSAKSLGIMFYLLTREYCKAKNIEVNIPNLDWWEKEEGN